MSHATSNTLSLPLYFSTSLSTSTSTSTSTSHQDGHRLLECVFCFIVNKYDFGNITDVHKGEWNVELLFQKHQILSFQFYCLCWSFELIRELIQIPKL